MVRSFGVFLLIIGAGFLTAVLVFWAMAPQASAMQIFQSTTPLWSAGCITGLAGAYIIDRHKH